MVTSEICSFVSQGQFFKSFNFECWWTWSKTRLHLLTWAINYIDSSESPDMICQRAVINSQEENSCCTLPGLSNSAADPRDFLPGLEPAMASPALVAEKRPPPNLGDLSQQRHCKITVRDQDSGDDLISWVQYTGNSRPCLRSGSFTQGSKY